MQFFRFFIVVTTSLLALASCKQERREPAAPPATPAATVSSPHAQAREPSSDIAPLVQRLAWEAENRPRRGVTVEQVFEALDRAGIVVTGTRQYLGVTVQASYCAGGVAADGIAISVCEYATPEAAAASKRFMEQRFSAMTPHTQRLVHRQALLTIAQPTVERGADVAALATNTFTSLQSDHP